MADVVENERRIMAAVDEGEESLHALSWSLKNIVSRKSKDTVILLYAKPPRAMYMPMPTYGTGYLVSPYVVAAMERYGHEVAGCVIDKAKKLCKDLQPDVKVETRVETGDARDVICEMVEKLDADVLVMGSHGYGFIKRAFIGSVSNHCVQNVKCPVSIVKKPKTDGGSK